MTAEPPPGAPAAGTSGPRVALVLGTSTGGVGVHVRSLSRHLVDAGWQVVVCGPASTHAVFDFARDGAQVAEVALGAPGTEIRAVPALRRATDGVDVVHAHGLRAGTAAALARRHPLVVTWHNAVLATGAAGRVLALGERFVARAADASLGASPDLVARIRGLGGRDVRLSLVTPPEPVPARTTAQVRAEFDLPEGRPLIVCVARLHRQKGLDVLIRAATGWRARSPVPLVLIAGDGPERAALEQLIASSGAPVRLLGRRGDVADLVGAADLVVQPSRWDARPLAVQEAMRLGRAVVATDVGGVAAMIGPAGVLVPAEDAAALDQAVQDLLDDPDRRATLGRRARTHAAREWPGEAESAQQIMAVYAAVRARGPR